jgi:hypothetical protein
MNPAAPALSPRGDRQLLRQPDFGCRISKSKAPDGTEALGRFRSELG